MDVASLIPSILGLGTKIATAVPGLKKPKREKVPQLATKFGAQIVGGSQSGLGASRGLALREGLRAAAQGVGDAASAQQAAAAGAEQRFQSRLDARNQNLASFGTDLAKGLGDMAAFAVSPKSEQGTTQDPNRAPVTVEPSGFGQEYTPSKFEQSQGLGDLETQVNDQEHDEAQQTIDQAGAVLEDFRLKREEAGISAAPEQKSEQETTAMMIDQVLTNAPQLAPAVEAELAQTLHAKMLMLAEAERKGLSLGEMLPRINRRLGLRPGQALQNPLGIGPDEQGMG